MQATRSDKYYFPNGDVVLQIQDILFKLHRDILTSHSGFFQDMFSIPTSDTMEGTSDEHPLRLPETLCLAQSFAMLCKFLYPRELAVFPSVLVKELDIWEPVLQATASLQIDSVRKYILSKLLHDKPNIPSEAARLLGIAYQYDETPEDLKLECVRVIVYRRQPLSPTEGATLGGETTARLMSVRERLQHSFLSATFLPIIPVGHGCTQKTTCQEVINQLIIVNIIQPKPKRVSPNGPDIFHIAEDSEMCGICGPLRTTLTHKIRRGIADGAVKRFLEELQARKPPSRG